MLTLPPVERLDIKRPKVVFTLRGGNPISVTVVEKMRELGQLDTSLSCSYIIYESIEEVEDDLKEGEWRPEDALVIFDGSPRGSGRSWSHHSRLRDRDRTAFPQWSHGARWGVGVNKRVESCARQTCAIFLRRFDEQLERQEFPWGQPKKKEPRPTSVRIDPRVDAIIAALNAASGPDLASAIAKPEFRHRLPRGSRISWNRVPAHPVTCNRGQWQAIDSAFAEFERACNRLLVEDPRIAPCILAGVHFADQRLARQYLDPSANHFSVRRPDVHYQGDGCFASENDEMPGGMAELFFIDRAYDTNQQSWQQALDWLFRDGSVLFLISARWSKVYLAELSWFVETLRERGYPAELATSDDLRELRITAQEVLWRGARIATVWRQFPIFETEGALAEIVFAAHRGVVRLVPEFAHFGNKAWFSVFRQRRDWFRAAVTPASDALLESLLPDSHLVRDRTDFPFVVAGHAIESFEHLCTLPAAVRNELVLKIAGANEEAARSRGVLMDKDVSETEWRRWINEKISSGRPLLVQRLMDTAVVPVPVRLLDGNGNAGSELFRARILVRPWSFGGRVVSAHAVAAPHTTRKVHGMVDMAILPVNFTD